MSTIDGIAAYVKCWHNAIEQAKLSKKNEASFMLSSGKRLDFKVREEYLGEGGNLKGSVVDLEAAYKQCPIHPDDYKNSVLVLKDPETNEPAFFVATALPFGAPGSVHGFNRLASAINFLAHSLCAKKLMAVCTVSTAWHLPSTSWNTRSVGYRSATTSTTTRWSCDRP